MLQSCMALKKTCYSFNGLHKLFTSPHPCCCCASLSSSIESEVGGWVHSLLCSFYVFAVCFCMWEGSYTDWRMYWSLFLFFLLKSIQYMRSRTVKCYCHSKKCGKSDVSPMCASINATMTTTLPFFYYRHFMFTYF